MTYFQVGLHIFLKEEVPEDMNKFTVELKGLGISVLMGVLLGVLASVLVYFTGLQETVLSTLGKAILVISVLTGGCIVSKARGNKGLVRGMSLGLAFFILMLIVTLLARPSQIYWQGFLYNLLACLLAGGIGGILGIGLSEE
jgi:putative membrane protein (TIGR04086 family)